MAAASGYLDGMNERPLIDAGCEKVLSLAAETQYAPNGVVSRTLLRTENARTVLFGFAEGQELTEHTSTQHALIQILSGACEFSLAGAAHKLKAGDLLYMPPNLPHAVRATEQFSMLLTMFKPATARVEPALTNAAIAACKGAASDAAPVVEVDARGLEPPQPMVKILEALAALPAGAELRARTDRRPIHLYAQVKERGFAAATEEQSDGSFLTHIRRP